MPVTRPERRRNERQLKKKLTEEQYADFKNSIIEDAVQDVLLKFAGSIEEILFDSLRTHGIGEDRANTIIEYFGEQIKDA